MKNLSKLLSIFLIGSMLVTVGCSKYDDDIKALNNRVDDIESQMNTTISPLKADLEAVKTQLAELVAADAELTAKHEADLKTLKDGYNALEARIKAIEDGKYADAIAEFEESIESLETIDAAFKDQLSSIAERIGKDEQALVDYKTVVTAEINELEARIATVEEALEDIKNSVIPGLEEQIANTNESVESILDTLKVMGEADTALQTLIETLEETVDARLAELEATMAEQYEYLGGEIARVEAELNAKLAEQALEMEALRKAIEETSEGVSALEGSVQAECEKLEKEIAAVKEQMELYNEELANEFKEALSAANGKIDEVAINTENLRIALEKLTADVDALTENLNKFMEETNNRLNAIEKNLEELNNKLAGTVQNITFVPEYNDGLATAVRIFGGKSTTLCATTLTATFDITPASAVSAIVSNGVVVIEPVKTRGQVLRGERLVIEPDEAVEGRVKVTAFVHNMPENFGAYAFTLGVEVDGNVLSSSDYVYIHEADDAEFEYALVAEETNASIEEHPMYNAEEDALVYSFKWTKAAEEAVDVLDGYVYKLTNGEEYFTLAEVEKKYGMAEGALDVEYNVSYNNYKECIKVDGTCVDMIYDEEAKMYPFIGNIADIDFAAKNNAELNISFKVLYEVACGLEFVDNKIVVEEAGDLYWLSQNQDYIKANDCTIEFKKGVELDMADYCNELSIAKFAPIANATTKTTLTVNGNSATVKNLTIVGDEHVGLFGYVTGDINDITVVDSKMTGNHWVGGIVAAIHGSVKNCHVDNCEILATPNMVGNEWDNGDKVGGIVGYSAPDAANIASYSIENCSVKSSNITAFRDVAGIAGYFNYGGDNLKNNTVENVNIVAIQREALTPGYYKAANIGRVIGRCDIAGAYAEKDDVANSAINTDIRIRYAVGAEVNVNDFDAAKHTLELSTANGLAWFSNHITDANYYTYQNVAIVKDIDFGGKLYFEDDEVAFEPINNWVGSSYRLYNFEGNNKTISNFKFDAVRKDVGLFGSYVGDIKNIRMDNVELKGLGRVAPIATQLWGNIDNCHVSNLTIKVYQNDKDGDKLGGIVAQMQDAGAITKCSVTNADIEGYRDLGAIAGHANIKDWDGTNKLSNVTIWINQTYDGYEAGHTPFKNESALVGRQTGEKLPLEANGVAVYNILTKSLERRYVQTRDGQLRLGYEKCTDKENAEALWMFASDYKAYSDVFQVTDMEITETWTAIGTQANAFKGTYNGNGKAIKGLKITNYNTTPSGLFGCVIGTVRNVNIINPIIYGSHYAGAVAAVLFGSVENCQVVGGEVIVMPNYDASARRFDNGDKAGALVGYLADSGVGSDKVINNTVSGVKVKAYRDVAALVGCANVICDMSGNTIDNCSIIADQITGKYPEDDPKAPNIGMLIGRLTDTDTSKVAHNPVKNSTLGLLVQKDGVLVTEQISTVDFGSVGE